MSKFILVFTLLASSISATATTYTDIGVSRDFTCALSDQGKVACWGMGPYTLFHPEDVLQGRKVEQLSTSKNIPGRACGLSDGKMYCWGYTLGVPPNIRLLTLKQISVGTYQDCAIDDKNTAYCWGDGYNGEDSVPADLGPVKEIAAGEFFNCVVKMDNTVFCWGDNTWGQLNVPTDLKNPRQLQTSTYNACAMTDDGLRCWQEFLMPQKMGKITQYALGNLFACGVSDQGGFCWDSSDPSNLKSVPGLDLSVTKMMGANSTACAVSPTKSWCFPSPRRYSWWNNQMNAAFPGTFKDLRKMIPGGTGSCALVGKDVMCWRDFPTKDESLSYVPADVNGKAVDMSVGYAFACALKSDGKVSCWSNGGLDYGQFNVPTNFVEPSAIASGFGHTCVIDQGVPRCWGRDDAGQASPPFWLNNVTQIALGDFHSCALSNDRVTCWGFNREGQTTVPNNNGGVVKLIAHGNHSCFLDEQKSLTCWGEYANGKMKVPADLGPVKDVSVAATNICALVDSGMKCWGYNEHDLRDSDFAEATALFGGWFSSCAASPKAVTCVLDPMNPSAANFWQVRREEL